MNKTRLRRLLKLTLAGAAAFLLVAQLVPVDRTNPPVESEVNAPLEVIAVLRKACYDCHSNETVWPWYSGVAPVSWLAAKDVREGREEINYSTWGRYTAEERAEKREETWHEVEEREMPLSFYLLMHPKARLSGADQEVLRAWALGGVR